MAHKLNIKDGKAAFFGTQPAWHGLGTIVEGAINSEEAIKAAGLDYNVGIYPLQACTDECREFKNKFATVREDTGDPLGVVGDRYTVLQNREAFNFVDDLVGAKEAIFESAGALGDGERIWLSCKLPNKLIIGKDDVSENYFFLTNSHDGSRSVTIAFTNVFIVCNNTLSLALKNARKKANIRHTKTMQTRLHDAAELLGISSSYLQSQKEMFELFRKIKLNDDQLRDFLESSLATNLKEDAEISSRLSNQIDDILNYNATAPEQLIEERKGNLWGAFNAVSGYFNNVNVGKNKLNDIMFGSSSKKIQKSFETALKIAEWTN